MNSVNLIGRLARDPEVRWTQDGRAVARFAIAINRGKDRNGNDVGADFPNVFVFGKQAENCEKYLDKGRMVGISGRLQTGSYVNKDGNRVYTTDVIASRVEFLSWGKDGNTQSSQGGQIHDTNPCRIPADRVTFHAVDHVQQARFQSDD